MKSTGLIQLVDKLHQAGKMHNLHQVCGIFDCVVVSIYGHDFESKCVTFSREAWKALSQMSAEDAMKNYINELTRINGNWEQCLGITQNINEVNIAYIVMTLAQNAFALLQLFSRRRSQQIPKVGWV